MLFADAISPPVLAHTLLFGWQTDWLSLISLALEMAMGAWYVVSTVRLARKGRPWSKWRTASFLAGIATIVVAVQSGLAAYDDSVFSIHVIQHLLLMNVAPIFLALGAPITLALQASDRPTQRKVLHVLHHPVVEFVTNPLLVLLLFSVTMIGYFLTPFYQFTLEHPLIHDLTHLAFLTTGCLYWFLVVGVDPSRWRLSYPVKLGFLAIDIPVGTLLGLGLTQSSTSIAPLFHTVNDTHNGGAILWIMGEIFTFVAMGIVVIQWMHADSREAARSDRRADAALAQAIADEDVQQATGSPRDKQVDADLRRGVTRVKVVDGRFINVTEDGVEVPSRSNRP